MATPTTISEIINACMEVFCGRLASAIVREMQTAGLRPGEETDTSRPGATCHTCLWFSGRVLCQREGSPHAHRAVHPETDTCALYQHTDRPRSVLMQKHDRKDHPQHRPRGTCTACGGQFPVSGAGLFPHDVKGVAYVAGRGDRSQPCPGTAQSGTEAP